MANLLSAEYSHDEIMNTPPENVRKITTKYEPRDLQYWLHAKMKRFNVLNLHRRFGKTVFAINQLKDKALRCELRNPHYAYVAPTFGQAKRVAWEYFKEFFGDVPGVDFKEGDLKVVIPRPVTKDTITIWLISAENPSTIRGMYLDGIILDEYADMNPIIWSQVVRPALSDRLGWAIFIGTPQGQNHFYDIYKVAEKLMLDGEDWFACTITAEQSQLIPVKELEEARLTMTVDEYNQEFMCDFNAALTGAYWSDLVQQAERDGRICDVPYDPAYNVATAWDLGISDSMAIWFIQKVPGSMYYHVIDYLEYDGKGIDFYIQELQAKCYSYGTHLLPHDAKQREFSTGKSRMDTFQKKGLRPIEVVPKVGNKADAIHAGREIIPMCKFDKEKCKGGIHSLRNYQREYDSKNKMYKDKPRHDWTSHGADSFQTFARGVRPQHFLFGADRYADLPTKAITDYNEYDY